jgi:hypothetical protein
MAGKKHRPRRLDEESRTWNIVFPVAVIERVKERADEIGVTPAGLVRAAVDLYLSGDTAKAAKIVDNNEFLRGVQEAAAVLRSIVTQPRYPAGHTLGDVLAQKVIDKIESDGPQHT